MIAVEEYGFGWIAFDADKVECACPDCFAKHPSGIGYTKEKAIAAFLAQVEARQ